MTSHVVLAIGYPCPANSNLAQYAPDSVSVWYQNDSAFVGMVIDNQMKDLIDISNIDKDKIQSQFDDYRKAIAKFASDNEWKTIDDRHDWFELFNSGNAQIVALAI